MSNKLIGKPFKVLDKGYVKLLDVMGSDEDIAQAARISTGKTGGDIGRLIDYLMRHRHTSPFEMAELKFEVKAPIFVARQWFRHRTGSYNEVSARYTELPEEYHVPSTFRSQGYINKQASGDELIAYQGLAKKLFIQAVDKSNEIYKTLLDMGVAREQAREVLPVDQYTKFIYKTDLHNLLHFLKLRNSSHAQPEIREYANVIEEIMKRLFPITWESWESHVKSSVTFNSLEMQTLLKVLTPELKTAIIRMYEDTVNDLNLSPALIREFEEKLRKE